MGDGDRVWLGPRASLGFWASASNGQSPIPFGLLRAPRQSGRVPSGAARSTPSVWGFRRPIPALCTASPDGLFPGLVRRASLRQEHRSLTMADHRSSSPGNIGTDLPEVRHTQVRHKITTFSLATSRPRSRKCRVLRRRGRAPGPWTRKLEPQSRAFQGLARRSRDICEKG